MAAADFTQIVPWMSLVMPELSSDFSPSSNSQTTISTTSSALGIPLHLIETATIDKVEVYLASGASTDFRCRIVERGTANLPSTTLVDAAATATISVSGSGWKTFDFTDFSLAPGKYWILLDSTSSPSTALAVQYIGDGYTSAQYGTTPTPVYWTGSVFAVMSAGNRCLRVRCKTTDGWLSLFPCIPSAGASGLNGLIMDTAENPSCRGNRFVAPASGKIIGLALAVGQFNTSTSFYAVLADAGCTTELARSEVHHAEAASIRGAFFVEFGTAVTVVAGTSYDLYITAGSTANSSQGVWISALDTSDDSGAVSGCFGVNPGDVLGMYVHQPATEGGAGTVTTTGNHIFPLVPVYGSLTTGGAGGGETSHVFAA